MDPNELALMLANKDGGGGEAGSGPTLRDIFDYIDNQGTSTFAITPNGMTGGEQGWGATGAGLTQADPQANNGADGNMPQKPVNFLPPEIFREGITLSSNDNNNEGSGGYHYNVDASKFPETPWGPVTGVAPVYENSDLYRRDLVRDDPNYGSISPARNFVPDRLNSMAFPLIMSGLIGGAGMIGAMPSWAAQLVQMARSLDNGGSVNWGTLANILAGQAGIDIPDWLRPLLSQGINAAVNGGKKP